MSKDWTPAELAAASEAMKTEGNMSYGEFCAELNDTPKKLTLHHIGRDSWSRPVYVCNERLYVDVDPRKSRAPDICTKMNNRFDGEPDTPIPNDIKVEFVPARDTWD